MNNLVNYFKVFYLDANRLQRCAVIASDNPCQAEGHFNKSFSDVIFIDIEFIGQYEDEIPQLG